MKSTESASAARQDEHILREKMKLGHNIREKKRNHTYHSYISNSQVAWHLRSTV